MHVKVLFTCLVVNCQLEHRVEKAQEEFDAMSKSIRKEVERFELQRYHDFKAAVISYLESVLKNQQQVHSNEPSFVLPAVFCMVMIMVVMGLHTLAFGEIGAGFSENRCHETQLTVIVSCFAVSSYIPMCTSGVLSRKRSVWSLAGKYVIRVQEKGESFLIITGCSAKSWHLFLPCCYL